MTDIICFSHLRWDFVYQRPQHLMSRAARTHRVFFIEEPVFTNEGEDRYSLTVSKENVCVITLFLAPGHPGDIAERQTAILEELFLNKAIEKYICWYYTPMMLNISNHLTPVLTVYDCMDELTAFKNADPVLGKKEQQLFNTAQIVFTGGRSLYRSKKQYHPNVFCFPSSIDFDHFAQARNPGTEPADQRNIPHPRLGFFGVVDERFDTVLLRETAALRPDLHFVIAGPVVKIDPAELPQAENIHYLGPKKYADLPGYVRGWDIALVLFALNDSTKFISPTKTPEYLAAGKPVLSTAIADVVEPYGKSGMVQIIHSAAELSEKADRELKTRDRGAWLTMVDMQLSKNSWDITWNKMKIIIAAEIKIQQQAVKQEEYV